MGSRGEGYCVQARSYRIKASIKFFNSGAHVRYVFRNATPTAPSFSLTTTMTTTTQFDADGYDDDDDFTSSSLSSSFAPTSFIHRIASLPPVSFRRVESNVPMVADTTTVLHRQTSPSNVRR